jgi:O-antigen/teichoic acid export membrane protein
MKSPKERLVKNIFSNWFGLAVSIAIAFYMNPFLVHHLGKEQYGIWALVFSVLAYAQLLDVGMQQALSRYLPKYYAVEDYRKLNEVINSSSLMYGIIGSLTIIMALVLAFFFVDIFQVSDELQPIMRVTMIIIGVNTAVIFYGMAATAIGPFHRYDIGNAISISFKIVRAATIIYFLSRGHGLITLAWITLFMTVAQSITKRWFQQRIVPQIRFGLRFISKERIREMIGYGTISFLIMIAWLVIHSTDNIIIGIFLSATSVTYYSIAFTIISYVRSLINAIGVPLVATVSHLEATSDLSSVAGLSAKMLRYLYYLCTGICVGIIFLGSEFINLWMGPGFELTVEILYILVIPACVFLPQVTSNSILMGMGRHRLLFYILSGEALSNIILSLILVWVIGLHGVALGTAIPQIIIYTVIYPVVFQRVLKTSLRNFYLQSGKAVLLGALVTVPTTLLVERLIPITGWFSFFTDVGIICIAIAVGFVLFVAEKSDRDRILSIIKR